MPFISKIPRRRFLESSAAVAGGLLFGRLSSAKEESDPYGGFKMGIQSYSLRTYDVETALEHTRTLGLNYWEAYSKHIPLSTIPSHLEKYRSMLDRYGVTLNAYGVVPINADENKMRELFDFAQAMGLASISSNPAKEKPVFDLLDRLCEEYQIPIAIHNHGPGATYDKISDVETWTKDRHPLIGACVDTGHYLRSDEDAVEAIERLGNRVFGVHLKDVKSVRDEAELERLARELPKNRANRLRKEGKVMTILGEGELDVLGCLKALRSLKYDRSLSLEYEENMQNPLSDIEVCLKTVRDAVKKLG